MYVKEENKRVGGAVEAALLANVSLEECQSECLGAERFLCRALEYDEATRQCALLEEDSVSQRDLLRTASSPSHHLYDLVCLDNALPFRSDNAATSHLFAHGRRPDTAFQRYRNSRLGGDFHSEITGRSLSECLDECLRQASFVCRSAVYSDRFRTCRLSRFGQRDGHRVIYDADYDYYENLMGTYPPRHRDGTTSQHRVFVLTFVGFSFLQRTTQTAATLAPPCRPSRSTGPTPWDRTRPTPGRRTRQVSAPLQSRAVAPPPPHPRRPHPRCS